MKQFLKISIFIPAAVLMFIIDIPQQQQPEFPYFQLVSEAHAIFGVRRRAVRRGVVIGSSMAATGAAAGATANYQPQEAPATVPAQPAPVQQQSASGLLPMGRIVTTLPKECTVMQAGGVEYHHCGVNYYRATFQGNNLVYVTTQPN